MSDIALYRKYRPSCFADIIGQEEIVKTIANSIKNDKVSHAYLFTGPRGIGKTSLARIIAKSVNCQKRKAGVAEPCNNCDSCREVTAGKSLDLIEIDAASNRGIDEIRELREKIKYSPSKFRYKIYIIDEAHMLTNEAFNALLKTLEEPPAHAVFILATTEPQKVPATIISRCQRFDFKKIDYPKILSLLQGIARQEKIKVTDESLGLIIGESEGCLRDAIGLFNKVVHFSDNKKIEKEDIREILGLMDYQSIIKFVNYLLDKNSGEAVKLISQKLDQGVNLEYFNKKIIEYLRLLLLQKNIETINTFNQYYFNSEQKAKIKEQADGFTSRELVEMIDEFIGAGTKQKFLELKQLPLELAVIKINGEQVKKIPSGVNKKNNDHQPATKTKNFDEDEEEEESNGISVAVSNVSLDKIKRAWTEIAKDLKTENFSLATIIKSSTPLYLEENNLIILCHHDFYLARINNKESKRVIAEKLFRLFKREYVIDCYTEKNIPKKFARLLQTKKVSDNKNSNSFTDDVIKKFGGELI